MSKNTELARPVRRTRNGVTVRFIRNDLADAVPVITRTRGLAREAAATLRLLGEVTRLKGVAVPLPQAFAATVTLDFGFPVCIRDADAWCEMNRWIIDVDGTAISLAEGMKVHYLIGRR